MYWRMWSLSSSGRDIREVAIVVRVVFLEWDDGVGVIL